MIKWIFCQFNSHVQRLSILHDLYNISVWKSVFFLKTQIHKLYFAVYFTAIFNFRGYLKSTWNSIHNPFSSGNGICTKYISEYTKINWLQGKKVAVLYQNSYHRFTTRVNIVIYLKKDKQTFNLYNNMHW